MTVIYVLNAIKSVNNVCIVNGVAPASKREHLFYKHFDIII